MQLDFADVLLEVIDRRASDLHITAGAPPTVRIRGRLVPMDGFPVLTPNDTREIVYSILSEGQRQKFENNWQIDFAYQIPGRGRFRVNAYFQRAAVGAAFRLIPFDVVPFETLGLPTVVADFANKPRGLVLVTGPTGSGKSTTLASLIDVINATREEHIMTVEDPIEFLHHHKKCIVNQRELGSDATSFGEALKAALRQDPDVILVGEMRDLETIGTALTAAETGHLVFATLHTQDTPQTIDRIIDVFPPEQQGQVRAQLSVALQGIMTQTLLPTADGAGRVVAAEVLVPTPAVRNLIREAKTHQIYSVIQTGASHGMQTMDAALVQLVRAGKVNRQIAESRAHAPEEFRRLIGGGRRRLSGGRVAMATYVFKAMDLAGVQAKGEVEADSKQAVAEQLKERGLVVVDIAHKYRSKELNIELFSRVNAKDLAVASRQLATMVTSGMTIMRALHVLETQTGSKMLRETVASVRHDVEAGLLLSDAMARHPKVFGPLYVAMVKAGETGGVLEECLMRVADQLEKDAALRRQVRAAMIYPAVDHHVRDRGSDGAGGVPDPGVRRSVQAVPGQAPGADTVHGELLPPRHSPVVHPDRRGSSAAWAASSRSSAPRADATSGMRSSFACR